jgi:hypothetical protein
MHGSAEANAMPTISISRPPVPPLAFPERLLRVPRHHAVAGQRQVAGEIPAGGISRRRQDERRFQDGGQAVVLGGLVVLY